MVLKSRFVVLARAGQGSVRTHLRYIERDGTTRDGSKGQAYGPETDAADLQAFQEKGRGDRHQFRMILSAEDADQLKDLKEFTREFMRQVSADLETPLDWVAVDHWDTDNPHTHVVLRGRTAGGQDLVISPDYMAHGMRMRASDIATEWLGPRTELEIRESLTKEMQQERFTSLDRTLLRYASEGVVDLDGATRGGRDYPQLRGRLDRLEKMGLAEKLHGNRWRLSPAMRSALTALGERGDVIRAIHRALKDAPREIAMNAQDRHGLVGRVAGRGLADEFADRPYLVVDGLDGRAHYVKLSHGADLQGFPDDAVIELRRAGPGKVEGCAAPARAVVLSEIGVAEQATARGPTWLDRQLLHPTDAIDSGFGRTVRQSLDARSRELVDRGLAKWRDGRLVIQPNLLATLQNQELEAAGRELAAAIGRPHLRLAVDERFSGVCREQVALSAGRFALIETERGFSLAPWKPTLEGRLGQRVSGVMRAAGPSWDFEMPRGKSL